MKLVSIPLSHCVTAPLKKVEQLNTHYTVNIIQYTIYSHNIINPEINSKI